ncbi:CGNR zinc finger domain-containing protein [Dermacoccus sp. Tok2021]|uniref:CGNR zinc finger domain-containing protein n=1 Tax=Dermacoccus sp. Tok2021 TaxID=2826873 RepID=UPI00351D9572|nr:CGNR zinc finger domain-containing protein [Dermacoccus sp. Tok2021]
MRHRIAIALIEFMARDDLDRLHQCEDEACGWVYLDTSPRRNRRWCVTADCGDRNRSRAYYARQKAKRSQSDPSTP